MEPEDCAAQLTAALRPHGVRTGQVWGTTPDRKGANRRGIPAATSSRKSRIVMGKKV
jgi:hypothetical protein